MPDSSNAQSENANIGDSANMLTVQQVARRLNVSQASIYRLIESGRLVAHRIGIGRGAIRVTEEQLRAYLDASAVTVPRRKRKRTRGPLRHIKW